MVTTKKQGRWTPDEIHALMTAYRAGRDVEVLAGELNRSTNALRLKASRLGLFRATKPKARDAARMKLDCMPNPLESIHKHR